MAKMSAYHKLNRKAKLRRNLGGSKDISYAADGMEPRFFRINFCAQPVDEHIGHVGLGIETVVEDVFEDHGFGDGAAGISHEVFQEGKFARLQFDLLAGAHDLAGEKIEGQIADRQAAR